MIIDPKTGLPVHFNPNDYPSGHFFHGKSLTPERLMTLIRQMRKTHDWWKKEFEQVGYVPFSRRPIHVHSNDAPHQAGK